MNLFISVERGCYISFVQHWKSWNCKTFGKLTIADISKIDMSIINLTQVCSRRLPPDLSVVANYSVIDFKTNALVTQSNLELPEIIEMLFWCWQYLSVLWMLFKKVNFGKTEEWRKTVFNISILLSYIKRQCYAWDY